MNLDKCRALVSAIDSRSISAAAARLGYTPSAVSRMVASLETDLGVDLLVRGHTGVTPTPACARLLPEIREMLYHEGVCEQLAAQVRGLETGAVSIGVADASLYAGVTTVVKAFSAAHPGITVDIKSGRSTELFQRLADRSVDICIASEREGDHVWQPLGVDELVAWVPVDHPLASREAVPVNAFATEPYIDFFPGLDVDNARVFAACGITPNTCYSTVDGFAAWEMVRAGLGITMNNRLNTVLDGPGVAVLPLDPCQEIPYGLARRTDASPAALVLWNALCERLSM